MPLMTASLPIFLRVAASIRAAILSKGLGIDLDVNDGTVCARIFPGNPSKNCACCFQLYLARLEIHLLSRFNFISGQLRQLEYPFSKTIASIAAGNISDRDSNQLTDNNSCPTQNRFLSGINQMNRLSFLHKVFSHNISWQPRRADFRYKKSPDGLMRYELAENYLPVDFARPRKSNGATPASIRTFVAIPSVLKPSCWSM
nr:MAG TPA_asm: hypothetical protein [Caudoviricetes sp.]